MIYRKPITEIKWEDVIDFCKQQIVEGATLDYKQDFPKDLSKTIAAFANTMGGIVLLGIAENDENKPLLPIQGIPFERGLSEKVMSMILSNITPPIIPEIQICQNEDRSRAVIVIRFPQSDQTPHAINNNTRVYIRTGNRNKYEELISIDKLQWLLNNRNKSIFYRENLLRNSHERFQSYFEREFYNHRTKLKGELSDFNFSRLNLVLSPVFPSEYICTPPELKEISNHISVYDEYFTSSKFPPVQEDGKSVSYQSGITLGLFIENYAYFTDLSSFGIYFYKQNLFRKFYEKLDAESNVIRDSEVSIRIKQFFNSAILFYQQLHFYGLLRFDFSIDGLNNFRFRTSLSENFSTLEQRVEYSDTCLSSELELKKKTFIFTAIKNLGWTYNIDIPDSYLDKI